MTPQARKRNAPYLLLAPAGVLFLAIAVSALMMVRLSFGEKTLEWESWTLANYRALSEGVFVTGFIRTLRLAVIATALVLLLSLPVSLLYARVTSRMVKRLILFIILLPLFINQLLQSYGWISLLGPTGIVNNLLVGSGIVARPLRLLYTETGVIIAMVQLALPLAVLPISSALRNIPASYEEAAAILGAPRLRVLWEIVVPLARPGLWAAFLLVSSFNISAFVLPLLLGGGRVTTVPMLIREQMGPLLNWPQGAALAVVLVLLTLLVQRIAGLQRRGGTRT
ncbi:MAG: ABC transporter permease [Rhizobiales bacterium]|nr:ABC transporter permease [Hyphomicrobiales bacterium]